MTDTPCGQAHYLFYLYVHGVGFNVETVEHKNVSFTSWDVGGRDKIVSDHLSSHYCFKKAHFLFNTASTVETLLSKY